jgi:hypothetical protein
MPVKRLSVALACAFCAFVLSTSAWAGGAFTYGSGYSWSVNEAYSSYFSPDWYDSVFYKTSDFQSVLTFIDNVSYGWHSTVRGPGTLRTHWWTRQMKKSHCKALAAGHSWAACTVYW